MTWILSDADVLINQKSFGPSQCQLCGAFLTDCFWLLCTPLHSGQKPPEDKPVSEQTLNSKEKYLCYLEPNFEFIVKN